MVERQQKLMSFASANKACRWNVQYGRLHIGNRWMAQSGFNTYDNTARMHYPLLPSFDTPDPLSQDYPSLSPYSHCAGNPLINIDIDGNRISAIIENNNCDIRKDADGIYQLFDRNNNIHTPNKGSFGSYLLDDINTIASGKNGNELLSFLENNKNNVSIENSQIGFFTNTSNYIIGYDETASEGGLGYFHTSGYGTTRPQYIALAHEFAHIEDLWKGTIDKSTWYNSGNTAVFNAEKYAVFKENQIRKEHNQPLRLYYKHITLKFQNNNLYIPIQASKADFHISDYIYLLKNYSR